MTNPEEGVLVKIGLHIEQDDSVPVPIIQLAADPDTDVLHVVATNYEGSADGARSVASTLELAAKAIRHELGGVVEDKPKRPRFNPRPAGPQAGK